MRRKTEPLYRLLLTYWRERRLLHGHSNSEATVCTYLNPLLITDQDTWNYRYICLIQSSNKSEFLVETRNLPKHVHFEKASLKIPGNTRTKLVNQGSKQQILCTESLNIAVWHVLRKNHESNLNEICLKTIIVSFYMVLIDIMSFLSVWTVQIT